MDHNAVVQAVLDRPGMYVSPPNFDTITSFLGGYDWAFGKKAMGPFEHWLINHHSQATNQPWSALILNMAFPHELKTSTYDDILSDEEKNAAAVQLLSSLWKDFLSQPGPTTI